MGELKIRRLDDHIILALKSRARARGVSLVEEARATLTASVREGNQRMRERLAAVRAANAGAPYSPETDSLKYIQEQRDEWG